MKHLQTSKSLSLKRQMFFELLEKGKYIHLCMYRLVEKRKIKILYNGEFDPGSGRTLAAGLIHASRGVTECLHC